MVNERVIGKEGKERTIWGIRVIKGGEMGQKGMERKYLKGEME